MKVVGVIGGSRVPKRVYEIAYRMGELIGERDYVLITGGLGGVMEAASKGAKEKGGFVIGVLPGNKRSNANEWVDVPIITGMGHARNVIIAQSADILIAIDGSVGTQSEIAFCHIYKKKIIGIECKLPLPFERVDSLEEAIEKVDEFFSEK